jgi:hypothetical protein
MSEQNSLKGTVQLIQPVETFDSGFQKQVLVLNTGGEYPQEIPIEFIKDSIQKLTNLQVGQSIIVGINIRGNEYNGKFYANIQGWKIDTGAQQSAPAQQPAPAQENLGGKDLPF